VVHISGKERHAYGIGKQVRMPDRSGRKEYAHVPDRSAHRFDQPRRREKCRYPVKERQKAVRFKGADRKKSGCLQAVAL